MNLSNLRKQKPGFITRIQSLSKRAKIILAVIIIIIIFLLARRLTSSAQAPQYQTAQVTRGTIISSVSESGNVSAGDEVNVTSPTDGIITQLYVNNGDTVSAGQNLFEVKATATPQEQASAYASYESAVNALQTAENDHLAMVATLEKDRQAILDAQNNVNYMNNNAINPSTKSTYTDLEKQSLQSQLTSAQETFSADEQSYNTNNTTIAADQAQENSAALAYQATQDSTVTAPISGTIANLTASLGGNVSASSGSSASSGAGSSGSGTGTSGASSASSNGSSSSSSNASSSTPVLVIANFNQLYVEVQASEVDVPNIKPGQQVTLTLDAYPDKTFVGTVNNVDTIGTVSSGVVTYNVYISFDYAPPGVEPGMSATASIETARHDNALMVPSTAVQTLNGQSYVSVLKNGKISQVPVTTGISSDTDTEITSGLTEGETVITSFAATGNSASNSSSPFSGSGLGGARGGFGGGGGAVFRTGGGAGGGRQGGGG